MSNSLHQGLSNSPSQSLDFIVEPLQKLLQDQTQQLTDILGQLAILAIRFQQGYLDVVDIDWTQELRTEVTFFKNLRHMSSLELCNLMTNSDELLFRTLCKQDIIDRYEGIENANATEIGVRWDKLCRAVQECVLVDRQLGHSIAKLAQVCRLGPYLVQSADHDGSTYFLRKTSTPSLL